MTKQANDEDFVFKGLALAVTKQENAEDFVFKSSRTCCSPGNLFWLNYHRLDIQTISPPSLVKFPRCMRTEYFNTAYGYP